MLSDKSYGSVAALHKHGRPEATHDQLGLGMYGQRGERLAAIVSVPNDHLVGASAEKAFDCGVDFACEQLAHLGILRIGLVLPAHSGDTFGVCDHENGFLSLSPSRGYGQQNSDCESH